MYKLYPGISEGLSLGWFRTLSKILAWVTVAFTSAALAQPLPNGTYTLSPLNAHKRLLEAEGGSGSNPTPVVIDKENNSSYQQWIFTNLGGDIYRLSPVHAPLMSLDVLGAGPGDEANARISASDSELNQQWAVTAVSGGYTLTPQLATGLRLNATGKHKGDPVNIAPASTSDSQIWEIEAVTGNVPPNAPTDLAATAGDTEVSLEWDPVAGATSYNIYRGATSDGQGTTPIASGVSSTTFTDSGLTNDTTYYYKVTAVNATGMSPFSNEASATPFVEIVETVGGGTVEQPAVGPPPAFNTGGPGFVLVKNWNFGANGTVRNISDMSAHFFYHDQFGTIGNGTNYGALTVTPNFETTIPTQHYGRQPYEGQLLRAEEANPIVVPVPNGGFETPDLGQPTNFDGTAPSQMNPTGATWTFEGTSGIAVRGSSWWAWYNPEGEQHAVIQGRSGQPAGKISVPVTFTEPGTYVVEFYAGRRFGQVQPLQITIDGQPVGNPISATGDEWNKATFTTAAFTIDQPGEHILAIAATDTTSDKTAFVDKVMIHSVGELVPVPPVREFTNESLKTFLVPLRGATTVKADKHNVGCGSFMAQFALPAGGSRLAHDLVWETRVRYVTPPYFWFAIWTAGQQWNRGAEMDLVESFGFDNGGGFTNFDGRFWHSDSVGGHDTLVTNFLWDWPGGMASVGVTNWDPTQYHVWQWVYRKDNTYDAYMDGIRVQSGTIEWTLGGTPAGTPLQMYFLFDGGFGHVQIDSVNRSLPASDLAGKFFEWDYSRVYLRP